LIELIGLVTLTISFIFSLYILGDIFTPITKKEFICSLKVILRYSCPRFLASFVYAVFFSLNAILAAHLASVRDIGYLTNSQSILVSLSVVVAPFNLILFPKISSMIGMKREDEIKKNLNYLIGASIQCSFFVFVQLMVFSDAIIIYWLGYDFLPAVPVMHIIFASSIFYIFSTAVGGVLEASKVRPINLENMSISLAVSLCVTAGLLYFLKTYPVIISLSIGFSSGLTCLGVLSYISIREMYPEKIRIDLNYLFIAGIINIVLGSIAITLKPYIILRFDYIVIFEIVLFFVYVLILWLLRTDWLRKIPDIILSEQT
ncbi:MAG: hypothetical protein WA063_04475, partial [Minisyncoccia bacterium]